MFNKVVFVDHIYSAVLAIKWLYFFLTFFFLRSRCYMNFPPTHSGALIFSGVPEILLSYQLLPSMGVSVFILSWEGVQMV